MAADRRSHEELTSLKGRRVLVTGAGGGMGSCVVQRLLDMQAQVVATDRVFGQTPSCAHVAADVATADGVQKIVEYLETELGGIDGISHCIGAALGEPGGVLALSDDHWALVMDTNFMSAVRLDRLLAPKMVAQAQGSIIHFSSMQWRRPHSSSPAYSAAKAALRNYSKGLSKEISQFGVRVNTVTPGFFDTGASAIRIGDIANELEVSAYDAEQILLTQIGGVPLGRAGRPEEVAGLVAFLLSDDSSYLTGAEFVADGGNNPVI